MDPETKRQFISDNHLVHERELEALRDKLTQAQETARDQIKSLEEKLGVKSKRGVIRQDSEVAELWHEDGPDGSDQQPTDRAIVQLKLDAIQLPFFNGDLTTWEAFRDLFEQLVDRSPKLSNTVKFHQLRSHRCV